MFKNGTNDHRKKLVLVFDKNGVVQNHAMAESDGETNTGILG